MTGLSLIIWLCSTENEEIKSPNKFQSTNKCLSLDIHSSVTTLGMNIYYLKKDESFIGISLTTRYSRNIILRILD